MTRAEFLDWATMAAATFADDGPTARADRAWAEKIRPHDPELADLYVTSAEANEALRRHLTRPDRERLESAKGL